MNEDTLESLPAVVTKAYWTSSAKFKWGLKSGRNEEHEEKGALKGKTEKENVIPNTYELQPSSSGL